MGAGVSAVQVITLIQSITNTIQAVMKHGPQMIEAIRGSRKPTEDGGSGSGSGSQQQDQQQIQRLVQQLQQYENKVDDLMTNQAELKKTIETLMCLNNQIINSVDSKGDQATNRTRAEIDIPQNLEDSDEILRNFWESLSKIEERSTTSASSSHSEDNCNNLDSEHQLSEHDSSERNGRMEDKLLEALAGIQECNICVEHYNDSDRLPCVLTTCGHTFCKQCIVRMSHRVREQEGTEFEWYYDSLRCPECRIECELDIENLTPNDWLVQLLDDNSSDEKLKSYKTVEEQCGDESSDTPNGAAASYPNLKNNGNNEDEDDDDIKNMKLIQRLEEEEKSWEYALQLDKEEREKHREIREREQMELALALSMSEVNFMP